MEERNWNVDHEPASQRFAVALDGQRARLEYERAADRLVITHILVPEAIGGRGIAGALVEAAMAHARAAGLKVVPRCPYAARYLSRHPEHADLLLPDEA